VRGPILDGRGRKMNVEWPGWLDCGGPAAGKVGPPGGHREAGVAELPVTQGSRSAKDGEEESMATKWRNGVDG
jgi:hypothetical protein